MSKHAPGRPLPLEDVVRFSKSYPMATFQIAYEPRGKRRAHVCKTRMVQASSVDRRRGCKRRLWRNPGKVLLHRLKCSSRNNVLHGMRGRWQAESLDGRRGIGFARNKPLSTAVHQARAQTTRGMQELNSTFCSHSTSQVASGA